LKCNEIKIEFPSLTLYPSLSLSLLAGIQVEVCDVFILAKIEIETDPIVWPHVVPNLLVNLKFKQEARDRDCVMCDQYKPLTFVLFF